MSNYAVARIIVRYGKLAEFIGSMEKLVPIMADQGWRLHESFMTIVGNFHEVYDIWELPSADRIGADLLAAQGDPRFPEVGAGLAASIESETMSLVTKTPFSP
jgi:hypothetical protein